MRKPLERNNWISAVKSRLATQVSYGEDEMSRKVLKRSLLIVLPVVVASVWGVITLPNITQAADTTCTAATLTDLNNCMNTGAVGDNVVITITDNINITSGINVSSGRNITIQSDDPAGHQLTLTSGISWAFRVGAAGQQLTLRDITLNGNSNSNTSLISFSAAGQLTLGSGAVLQGHTTTTATRAAVELAAGATVNIEDGAIIRDNRAPGGGAIYANITNSNPATINISGGRIYNNFADNASYGGGAIHARQNTIINISGGVIGDDNPQAAAPYNLSPGKVATTGNHSEAHGGAIYIAGNASYITQLNISGGAIAGNYTSNYAARHGGGVFTGDYVAINITGGAIDNNTTNGNGGGIYQYGANSSFSIADGGITNNIATGALSPTGGGALIHAKTVSISGGHFDDNWVIPSDGANYSAIAGGIQLTGPVDGTVDITGGTFSRNHVIANGLTSQGLGGGMRINGSLATFTNFSNVVANDNECTSVNSTDPAKPSGANCGIYINGTTGLTAMDNITVTGNVAATSGGGLVFSGTSADNFTLTNSVINNNSALSSGYGGFQFATNGTLAVPKNVTITNCEISGNQAAGSAGGVAVGNYTNLTVNGSTRITNNRSGQGTTGTSGGIYVPTAGRLTLSDNAEISNNQAGRMVGDAPVSDPAATVQYGGVGGGVMMAAGTAERPAALTITDNAKISDNQATSSVGGVQTGNYTEVELSGNGQIVDNLTRVQVGGISVGNDSKATIKDYFKINHNTAMTNIGGVNIGTNGVVLIEDSAQINGNVVGASHGGLFVGSGTTTVTIKDNVQVNGNLAGQTNNGSAGGISFTGASLTLEGEAQVNNNQVGTSHIEDGKVVVDTTGNGGGVLMNAGSLTIDGNVSVSGNTTTGVGGGVYVNSGILAVNITGGNFDDNQAISNGGGFYLRLSLPITISGASISGNQANIGGGLYYSGSTSSFTVADSILENNQSAAAGGAIYSWITGGSSLLITGQSRIAGNQAGSDGGGVCANSLAVNGDVVITDNKAQLGGGILLAGDQPTVISGSVEISGNEAYDGGGIYLKTTRKFGLSLSDTVQILDNTATNNGGGVWADYESLPLIDVAAGVQFAGNSAATSEPVVAPIDLPTYNAHVLTTQWTTPFARGYNNYDIAYAATKFKITFDPAGGEPAVADVDVYHGDVVSEPTVSRAGYNLVGWFYEKNGEFVRFNFDQDTITSDLFLVAVWELISPDVPNTGLFGTSRQLTIWLAAATATVSLATVALVMRRIRRVWLIR
ncbi:MAG: InlB B-repeat-containing protein [Candidatus Nomurabacteria bacterium]|nr:InlB B-repeat-containing protein [Candidatus Nomurabacteria bacterium]